MVLQENQHISVFKISYLDVGNREIGEILASLLRTRSTIKYVNILVYSYPMFSNPYS